MTGILASVRNAAEARQVLPAGVNILDAKEPGAGALGAVDDATLREIVVAARGVAPVSATVGDLAPVPQLLGPAIARTWSAGVDIVKVGVFTSDMPAPVLELLAGCSASGVRIVLVYFVEHWTGSADFDVLRQAGISGVMLDTRDKQLGPLTERMGIASLQTFIHAARATGLMTGLAGSLREEDIAPLAGLAPDYLGFRSALCGDAGRGADVDPDRARRMVAALRAVDTGVTRRHGSARATTPAQITA